MTNVVVCHNFETAHRLPQLGGKCGNLHGHSWWVEATVTGEPDELGVVVDFGELKADLRGWVDTHLDHGAMLGADDPLVPALEHDGSKLFLFGADNGYTGDLAWPTVENVAELLHRVTAAALAEQGRQARCSRVRVTETSVNAAEVIL